MKEKLFFVALLPGKAIREEVTQFKRYAAAQFDSARALRSPPHITIFHPFPWPADKEAALIGALEAFSARREPFSITLSNFDCFAPRVIFVDVVVTPELTALRDDLCDHLLKEIDLKNKDTRPYHPHMTIAFKDLERSVFPKAWAHFRHLEYQRSFTADRITLLHYSGQEWVVYQDFLLDAK